MAGDLLDARGRVEAVYREESRRVFATLVRLLGDFDLAEEAMHDAFALAVERWGVEGVPGNPRAWLISAGRFRGIDAMRRRARHDASLGELAERLDREEVEIEEEGIEDDRLRLIFTCCHPALPAEGRLALTLREVCGLTTEEIASAFLTAPSTVAQRIVRAKGKIKVAGIPYQVPGRGDLAERLETVLYVIYLVFNEGYSDSSGVSLTRGEVSGEAIRLGRLLEELLPEAEGVGLLGLMLLQESRRSARSTVEGEVVLLEDQDRSLWNRGQIEEGLGLVRRAMGMEGIGAYTLQAAIAAEHARAGSAGATDWGRIAAIYDVLLRVEGSPVVELNRAVAVAMRVGAVGGLGLVYAILARGELGEYHYAHAARADLCRRLGRVGEAREAYEKALELARQEPEKRFLRRRMGELGVG
jgi:RNA polymerase sigma-70 factor (ECF subfamily)